MIVGVDVGGTFTDFVYVKKDGSVGFLKILSTPRSPEIAVIEGLRNLSDVSVVVHATTIATNALRGQIGLDIPKVALVTTRGFKDVIEIGRQNRPKLYDPFFEKPRPLVPRELRFEVNERIDYKGNILVPLNPSEVENLGVKLKSLGVVSVAISLLHSYANPLHEAIIESVLSNYIPYVSASYKVSPEPREYERITTLINAVLMPLISRYVERLFEGLKNLGIRELSLMSSSGGLVNVEEALARPVQLVESGPAAGVVATAELAKILKTPKAISFDMGGTTAKAGTIVNYEFEITTEYEVGGESHHGRIIKGSGYPVRFPFIDLAEVSAGGGTIIWRDEAGALRVGPISAGADPGPTCYGKGGMRPTITDANLILGRLGEQLLDGSMKLDKNAALKALTALGDPLEVAWEAVKLANLEMARAIRLVTVERGLDPSEFTLVAFGGAGPQHATEIALELGINKVIIPPHPGLFSALGLLMTDWRFEARTSYPKDLEEAFERIERDLSKRIGNVDYFVRYADVRYEGQGWELTIPVGKPAKLEDVRRAFEEKHLTTFGFTLDRDIEVVVARVFAVMVREKLRLPKPKISGSPSPRSIRRVYFEDGWLETPIYWRNDIPLGYRLQGPLIIEEYDSTTVVPPGWSITVGELSEILLERVS